ncbi:PfkB family carbohydrate kinase [Demequina sp. NBRC 110052]|uniref:PfkB family carbohydrate kinase n=1 Tax=Demequina sp. NBRC 110052 TaxID=1570341 RepID=UPI0013564DB5|nr:PfkB family carbohydrate kinase [Demequina sp. NBRC 110052]
MTGSSTPRALFAGLATLDIVQLVERLPQPNEKVGALDFLVAAGGPAVNAAVAAAHCGSEASLLTALPAHPLTELIRADLGDCRVGLEIADVGPDPTPPTAAIMITRATGDRAVVSPTGGAMTERVTPGEFDAHRALEGVRALLIDGYHRHLALPLALAARERGIPVILDAGSWKPYTPEVLEHVDLAVVSDDFAPPGTDGEPGAVLDALSGLGVERIVITRGARPILVRLPRGDAEVAVEPVDVVDTLGAGDFIHGALTHRIAELGLRDARLVEDLAWASRVAGTSLGSFGTRAWLRE